VIRQGLPVEGIFFIQHGKVKVVINSFQDREQIVRLAADGHILGHRGLGNDLYPISAIALDDSLVCFVKNEVLNKLFHENPKLVIALMQFYSQELRKMEIRVMAIAQMIMRERIADALLLFCESFGLNSDNELNVSFSREDIASMAATASEQTIRQLTEFEKEGFIAKRGRKIALLNVEGLKKIIHQYIPYPIKESYMLLLSTAPFFQLLNDQMVAFS
jgi:CRP-like cAMP-binding protein